jgi:hypothetical protein
MKSSLVVTLGLASVLVTTAAHPAPRLLAIGTLSGTADLSNLLGPLENSLDQGDVLGGMGSGLAFIGNNTFLALPDRGPNANAWPNHAGDFVDNTTSYISRFHTVSMSFSNVDYPIPGSNPGAVLPLTLIPTLNATTLLFSPAPLNYGPAVPAYNTKKKFYFSGRSDNFAGSGSLNPRNARLDPESIRASHDGKVYISDEYGPYVYEFNRRSGKRTRTFTLPAAFEAANLSGVGATEIRSNTVGRVANKGMEGLAITPDGETLIGFEQSPLIQDGGDGGRTNRIVTINIETGRTHQYVYDNFLADKSKTFNSSEILAINRHEFLVLERDGKGLGDGSKADVKRLYWIDIKGATDVGALNKGAGISGQSTLLPYAVLKGLFLDIRAELNTYGIGDTKIPAKLEGAAFGDDITVDGTTYHTLWIANDNDFVPATAGDNQFFVFGFTDADIDVAAKRADANSRTDGLAPQKLAERSESP